MREIAEAEVAMLGEVFQRFVEKSPIAVRVRGVLERVLSAEALDAWYEQTAQKQYTWTLLFSTIYELMSAADRGADGRYAGAMVGRVSGQDYWAWFNMPRSKVTLCGRHSAIRL